MNSTKIKNQVSEKHINQVPVGILTDAAQHMAGIKLFVESNFPKRILSLNWQTNDLQKCLLLIRQAEPTRSWRFSVSILLEIYS